MAGACLRDAGVQLCDPSAPAARDAVKALSQHLAALPAEALGGATFDHALAPLLARLGSGGALAPPVEELLGALALLLERAGPASVPPARAARVFPLVMERLLPLLEGSGASAPKEEAVLAALRCAEALLGSWYSACDRSGELVRLQVGFLVHLAVRLADGGSRELRLRALQVLRHAGEAEDDADALACFYPGVCSALAGLLIRADFKLGSKVVAAACDAWRTWLAGVLADSRNLGIVQRRSPLRLADLFWEHNQRVGGTLEAAPDATAGSAAVALAAAPGRLPKVLRDAAWLEEVGARTGEALCAALRPQGAPTAALWAEKASVRLAFLRLAATAVGRCSHTLPRQALEATLEVLLGGLSDDAGQNRGCAAEALRRQLDSGGPGAELQQQLLARLPVALQEVLPPPGRALDTSGALQLRLARADGLLRFLRERGAGEHPVAPRSLPAHGAEALVEPLAKLCALDPQAISPILRDARSLVALPVSGIGGTQSFLELFPYGSEDRGGGAVASPRPALEQREGAGRVAKPAEAGQSSQVKDWLLRALRAGGGEPLLAQAVERLVARVLGVFAAEHLFSIFFDDVQCQWAPPADAISSGAPDPSPLDRGAEGGARGAVLARRGAVMFAMAAWLDVARKESLLMPLWVPRHCAGLALQGIQAPAAGAAAALHCVGSLQLLHSALDSLHTAEPLPRPPKTSVHAQVKSIIIPLLEKLGSSSFACSTAAHAVLSRLHELLLADGSCRHVSESGGAVQALLAAYADYVVGDVCFRLKYDAHAAHLAPEDEVSGLPAILTAVVQHVDLDMVPFLWDIVRVLLDGPGHLRGAAHRGAGRAAAPHWVARALAAVVKQLAGLIVQRRAARAAEAPSAGARAAGGATGAGGGERAPSALAELLLGRRRCLGRQVPIPTRRGWTAERRQNGFRLEDLGACFDEDAEPDEEPDAALLARPAPSRYGRERQIASGVILWVRHLLQSSSSQCRHLAHVALVHSLTVLSTRAKELLPHVHNVWPALLPSFAAEAPLAAQADACVALKHIARLSGDFVQRRFVSECWPGLWARLRDAPALPQREAAAWSPKLKGQLAALDALAFLAGDEAVICGVEEELVVVGLKFLEPGAAHLLRARAWALLEALAAAEPDLLWLYAGRTAEPPAELPLLAEAGASLAALADEDRRRLRALVERQDSPPRPCVPLSPVGEVWCAWLRGERPAGAAEECPGAEAPASPAGEDEDEDEDAEG
ncbi:unnamed protein product [Prorocentrum cordatum]|uniref:Uncharacterized protein n=1 Tax=Prorocentrum cordatum TaxID=2364126 RepID=A0ABN9R733_9DINO|nr:unnamed protein product [Polarella glacialis]